MHMIFDCIIFFNELDLLEIRMLELDRVVDRFVIVEAPVTFSGKPKPLVFAENAGRFSRWSDRIVTVVADDMPLGPDPWTREAHQRNAVNRGLRQARAEDGVILSDADEIPSADAVRRWDPAGGPRRFEQLCSYYWINCTGGGWAGSRILTFAEAGAYPNLAAIRHTEFPILPKGGWHFSYLGGPDGIAAKIDAYSHQELNQQQYKDRHHLSVATSLGIDLFGRDGMRWTFCPVDDRFPAALRELPDRFGHLICQAAFHEDWYADDQVLRLAAACERTRGLPGAVLDFGCWEGRSTIAIANACNPEPVIAVDSWAGYANQHPKHETVQLARERDIFAQFARNVETLTAGNVRPERRDAHDFLAEWDGPVKFAHIDASHDYASVRRTIEACLPFVVPGGILCGDDYLTAGMGRGDLDGGVERAVRELLPGFDHTHNFWQWQRPE
jgi:beta-1,4-mannosyl-glycoprotein beta-1,4-N-acetylglucosaminyltransferase